MGENSPGPIFPEGSNGLPFPFDLQALSGFGFSAALPRVQSMPWQQASNSQLNYTAGDAEVGQTAQIGPGSGVNSIYQDLYPAEFGGIETNLRADLVDATPQFDGGGALADGTTSAQEQKPTVAAPVASDPSGSANPASKQQTSVPANLQAVDYAMQHVGEGAFSKYGLFESNSEVGGRKGQFFIKGFSAPKCNILVYDAYDFAGAAPQTAAGSMPLAHDWFNPKTLISATNGGGSFEVVAEGNLSAMDLNQLRPGDIISTDKHVGIYAPILYTSGEDVVPGFLGREIINLGGNTSQARGEQWLKPQTISAATLNPNKELSSSPTQPWLGGVTRNNWGFRGDSHDNHVVVRRLIFH